MNILKSRVRILSRVACRFDGYYNANHVEKVLLDFMKGQSDEFNGFKSIQSADVTLQNLFPHMKKDARKTLNRAMREPIIPTSHKKN